jgi:hypothetical protein
MAMDDFFNREDTLKSIELLARADPLVVFVGAGVPASVSVPTWWQLLEQLLTKAAKADDLLDSRPARDEYVDALMRTYDPWFLGSLVRQTFPNTETLSHAIREELYRRRKNLFTADLSTSFVRAVWQLILTRRVLGRQTLVLTTNYDDVLETTLERDHAFVQAILNEQPLRVESRTQVPEGDDSEDVLPIYHLHGYVPRDETKQLDYDIVMSAHDYGRDWSNSWSSAVLEKYWDCQWVFVGMSFTDSHVNFYLNRRGELRKARGNRSARSDRRPIGVFSLQGKDWESFEASVRPALVRAEKARLAELEMTPLATDYFFQDAQLLREVCLTMKHGVKRKLRYANRRSDWYRQFLSKRLPEGKPEQTRQFLEGLSEHLRDIRSHVEQLRPYDSSEMFKVELWCRDVDERALFQVGSSEFVHHDPRGRARRFSLTTRTRGAAAVSAFTRAAPDVIDAPIAQEHGRWRSFFAMPISLGEAPWFDLPVGALVIASTADEGQSCLQANQDTLRRQLWGWLPPVWEALDPTQKFDGPGESMVKGLLQRLPKRKKVSDG